MTLPPLLIAPDADGEPTLWDATDPDRPLVLDRKHEAGPVVWAILTAHVAMSVSNGHVTLDRAVVERLLVFITQWRGSASYEQSRPLAAALRDALRGAEPRPEHDCRRFAVGPAGATYCAACGAWTPDPMPEPASGSVACSSRMPRVYGSAGCDLPGGHIGDHHQHRTGLSWDDRQADASAWAQHLESM